MGKYADLADKKIKEKEDVNKDSKRTREEGKKRQAALMNVYHICKGKAKELVETVIEDLATSKSGTKISWHESESANLSFGFSVKGGCHFHVELELVNPSDFDEKINIYLVCKFVTRRGVKQDKFDLDGFDQNEFGRYLDGKIMEAIDMA